MDDLLKECFLKSLKTVMDQAKLPLLTSTFYSVFVCPQCPSYKRLDVKRSSFRKVSVDALHRTFNPLHICAVWVTDLRM